MSDAQQTGSGALRVCVVGSGMHFVSGISYYTYYLTRALGARYEVSAILMRRLIPRRWYPGRERVGASISPIRVCDVAPTFDGVDWWGIPSVLRALRFLRERQPDVLILQWWSAAVLPWYLLLARAAARQRAALIVELHELQDTGESRLPAASLLGRAGLRMLCRQARACVVHSDWDRQRLADALQVDPQKLRVILHGPFAHASSAPPARNNSTCATVQSRTDQAVEHRPGTASEPKRIRVLFFGTIRPYKGLEHLVRAFDRLPRAPDKQWYLSIVGETWEGWTLPLQEVDRSHFRDDIEVINRYVTDAEAAEHFARADVVALPYLRSSASGPLAIAKACGLPVVVTDVGGLAEAVAGYSGAVLVRAADVDELVRGLVQSLPLRGRRHRDITSWDAVADAYELLLTSPSGPAYRSGAMRSGRA